MPKLRFLVSLMTKDNDYQLEQANDAEQAARKLGVDCEIIYGDNDAVTQSTQILKYVQAEPEERPNAIVCEPPGGTALRGVGHAAVNAGIGWAVLNRDADYLTDLRRGAKVPAFVVSTDQLEVGRIQARQCAALLPMGGNALCIQGPSESSVAKERFLGMQEAKRPNLHLITLKGQWTEDSAIRVVSSWLKLSTSQKTNIDMVVAQNDVMAVGARKAIQQFAPEVDREHWLQIPFLGIDGVPKTGQAWVRSGLLAASVFCPPDAGRALELFADSFQGSRVPAERVLIPPSSIPPLEQLRPFPVPRI